MPADFSEETHIIAGCASHPCEKPVNGKHKGGCTNCAFSRAAQNSEEFTQIATNQQYGCKLNNAGGLFQDQEGKVFLKIGNRFFPKEENPNLYQATAQINTASFIAQLV